MSTEERKNASDTDYWEPFDLVEGIDVVVGANFDTDEGAAAVVVGGGFAVVEAGVVVVNGVELNYSLILQVERLEVEGQDF